MPLPSWNDWRNGTSGSVNETVDAGPPAMYNKLNEATQDELTAIKGIGIKTATRILAALPITNLDQLLEREVPQHIINKLEWWLRQESDE